MANNLQAAAAEFVATFALIFVGAGASILYLNGVLDLTGVALAHGLVLAIMVSITAHLSGGLVNPAVSVSLWVTGKLAGNRAAILIAAQVLGAVAGRSSCARSRPRRPGTRRAEAPRRSRTDTRPRRG